MSFFISDAMAQTAAAQPNTSMNLIFMILLFAVFYLLLIRPQQKRQKEHRAMVAGLETGDEVVTMGGVLGKITKVDENFVTLEIAKGTEIRLQKASVQAMMPKGTV